MTTRITLRRCCEFSRGSDLRVGLTLIEVVCGVTLAGTLLVGLVLAHAAHARQIKISQDKLAAIAALDSLLKTSRNRSSLVADGRSYAVPGTDRFVYRASLRPPQHDLQVLRCRILQVSIALPDRTSWQSPLAAVEILVPAHEDPSLATP